MKLEHWLPDSISETMLQFSEFLIEVKFHVIALRRKHFFDVCIQAGSEVTFLPGASPRKLNMQIWPYYRYNKACRCGFSSTVTVLWWRYYPEARATKEHQEHHAQQSLGWSGLKGLIRATYLTSVANNVSVFDRHVQGVSFFRNVVALGSEFHVHHLSSLCFCLKTSMIIHQMFPQIWNATVFYDLLKMQLFLV